MKLLSEGQIIRGTYEVERFLGEGAFAEVYRVKHRFLGRQAMKVFKTTGMTVEETENVLEEAILLSQLGHPNIVRVFDANITETSRGQCGFFTMEYVAGGSLEQFWKSHGRQLVPVETAVEILCQCCRGLANAHGEKPPIIHRDIKPQNILVGYDRAGLRARVSDFGLAKRVNPLTLAASARGTWAFKPPEAFEQLEGDSCAGDVWALGCTLYLLLTDRLPFEDDEGPDSTEAGRFDRPVVPPSRLNINVDAALDQITQKALAHNARDRYATATDLLAHLSRWRPHAPGAPATGRVESTKIALGGESAADEKRARSTAKKAFELARKYGKLADAADLLEESFNCWPELREEYEYWAQLWRKGVMG